MGLLELKSKMNLFVLVKDCNALIMFTQNRKLNLKIWKCFEIREKHEYLLLLIEKLKKCSIWRGLALFQFL